MKDNLFLLLSVGLETRAVDEVLSMPFSEMSLKDWQKLRGMADKQSVSAIVFDGLTALVEVYGKEQIAPVIPVGEWQMFIFDWIGVMTQVEQQNKQQLTVLEDMASCWTEKGCRVMVMKGQASGTMYPRPEHRSPGDIDCYLFDNYAKGNEIARANGANVDDSWYKHTVISYKGETFENHQYFVHTRDGKRGKRLNWEFVDGLRVHDSWFTDERAQLTKNTYIPPVQWTAMFLTYHACAHFISEGLRLKQILDWAMFLKVHQNDVDWGAFTVFCDRNHLRVFANAMNTIAAKYLGIKVKSESLEVEESPYADKIMHSTLYDEDYVFNSGKSGWANRLHIVKNMFNYRWKYEEIYQTSVWQQLWWYVSGYLFKTEKKYVQAFF